MVCLGTGSGSCLKKIPTVRVAQRETGKLLGKIALVSQQYKLVGDAGGQQSKQGNLENSYAGGRTGAKCLSVDWVKPGTWGDLTEENQAGQKYSWHRGHELSGVVEKGDWENAKAGRKKTR